MVVTNRCSPCGDRAFNFSAVESTAVPVWPMTPVGYESAVDGSKPGQRKILFGCFKRKLKSIRVAQLAGYVSEHTAYHHGEQSLQGTIIGMAQTYIGSNNEPEEMHPWYRSFTGRVVQKLGDDASYFCLAKAKPEDSDSESEDEIADTPVAQLRRGYDYLLRMSISSLTAERYAKIMKERREAELALDELKRTDEKTLWERDLAEADEAIKRHMAELERVETKGRSKKTSSKLMGKGTAIGFKLPAAKRSRRTKKTSTAGSTSTSRKSQSTLDSFASSASSSAASSTAGSPLPNESSIESVVAETKATKKTSKSTKTKKTKTSTSKAKSSESIDDLASSVSLDEELEPAPKRRKFGRSKKPAPAKMKDEDEEDGMSLLETFAHSNQGGVDPEDDESMEASPVPAKKARKTKTQTKTKAAPKKKKVAKKNTVDEDESFIDLLDDDEEALSGSIVFYLQFIFCVFLNPRVCMKLAIDDKGDELDVLCSDDEQIMDLNMSSLKKQPRRERSRRGAGRVDYNRKQHIDFGSEAEALSDSSDSDVADIGDDDSDFAFD
ncbi:MAG: hypothetical protein MHM6MM_001665 [Cercozoa sp. M6MM]